MSVVKWDPELLFFSWWRDAHLVNNAVSSTKQVSWRISFCMDGMVSP